LLSLETLDATTAADVTDAWYYDAIKNLSMYPDYRELMTSFRSLYYAIAPVEEGTLQIALGCLSVCLWRASK